MVTSETMSSETMTSATVAMAAGPCEQTVVDRNRFCEPPELRRRGLCTNRQEPESECSTKARYEKLAPHVSSPGDCHGPDQLAGAMCRYGSVAVTMTMSMTMSMTVAMPMAMSVPVRMTAKQEETAAVVAIVDPLNLTAA